MLVARAPSLTVALSEDQKPQPPPGSRVVRVRGPSHRAPQGSQKLLAAQEQRAQKHLAKWGPRSPPPPPPREPGTGGVLGREANGPARPSPGRAPIAQQSGAEAQGAPTWLTSDTLQFWILWVSFTYIWHMCKASYIPLSLRSMGFHWRWGVCTGQVTGSSLS